MTTTRQPMLDFEVRGRIHIGTIRTSSVLSPLNVVEFGNEVLAYVHTHAKIDLLLNFEHVDYLSSAVLTELLRINNAIKESGGRLRLCAVSPVIQEVFQITNLDKIFHIDGDGLEAGVTRFNRAIEVETREAAWKDLSE